MKFVAVYLFIYFFYIATESKLLPDCSDYTVYWLETRAGQPNPTTGIPPSLYTLKVTDFLREPGLSYHI